MRVVMFFFLIGHAAWAHTDTPPARAEGPKLSKSISLLIADFESEDGETRMKAEAELTGALSNRAVVRELMKALQHRDIEVRMRAERVLETGNAGQLGQLQDAYITKNALPPDTRARVERVLKKAGVVFSWEHLLLVLGKNSADAVASEKKTEQAFKEIWAKISVDALKKEAQRVRGLQRPYFEAKGAKKAEQKKGIEAGHRKIVDFLKQKLSDAGYEIVRDSEEKFNYEHLVSQIDYAKFLVRKKGETDVYNFMFFDNGVTERMLLTRQVRTPTTGLPRFVTLTSGRRVATETLVRDTESDFAGTVYADLGQPPIRTEAQYRPRDAIRFRLGENVPEEKERIEAAYMNVPETDQ